MLLPSSLPLLSLLLNKSRPLLQYGIRRQISSSFNAFSYKSSKSGYESETAEIKDSLRQFSLSENVNFIDDDEDEKKVELSHSMPLRSVKKKSDINRENSEEFNDFKRVNMKGGKGGDGMICFLHLYRNEFAGPSGGDGGHGGHVVLQACKNTRNLNHIKTSYTGLPGEKGQHKDMTGANAKHLFLKVPVGTLVMNAHDGKLMADLNTHDMLFLAAKGGAGGKGNHFFLDNRNRHPFVAEVGASGQEVTYFLELKILAHAGLVGFPNAGKSTLLNALTRAKPKVASYPFTTLKPCIGIIQYDDDEQLAIADLPGIIEDANLNKGLGIDFLRHIEKCVCLFYVIDISTDDPYKQFEVLMNELEQFRKDLSKRPIAVIVNKMDVEQAEERLQTFRKCLEQNGLSHLKTIPVSGKYGHNLTELLVYFRELYDLHRFDKFTKEY